MLKYNSVSLQIESVLDVSFMTNFVESNIVPKQWVQWRHWLKSPLGKRFLQSEKQILDNILPPLFGYHFLIVGEPCFGQMLEKSTILHKILLHLYPEASNAYSSVRTRQDKLPIVTEGVDVIYLAHCLEFVLNPHEVLREAYRSLMPEGYLVISSLNPWSSWGVFRFFAKWFKQMPWNGNFMSSFKLQDWLTLLGFDILRTDEFCFYLPVNNESFLKRFEWLSWIGKYVWPFWGAGILIVAQKKIETLTPIKPNWMTKKRELASNLIEPSA